MSRWESELGAMRIPIRKLRIFLELLIKVWPKKKKRFQSYTLRPKEPPSRWEGGASSLAKRSIVWKNWEPGGENEFVIMKEVFPKLIENIIYEKIDFKTFKKR